MTSSPKPPAGASAAAPTVPAAPSTAAPAGQTEETGQTGQTEEVGEARQAGEAGQAAEAGNGRAPGSAGAGGAARGKGLEPADGDLILAERFAPWVRALGLRVVETGARHAVLRLPWSDQLARDGGGLSGQAMMAAADTATVVAVSCALGGFAPMTTVQQSITFQRAARDTDLLVTARLTKLGRRIAFAEITLAAPEAPDDPVAHATTVYAFPG